jgi:transcriptional regulator with XRE-family HTH domain
MSPQRLNVAIRRAREAKGLSQLGLAKRAKVTQGYISDLEAGTKKNPGINVLRRLAKALGIPVAALLD